MSTRTKQKKQAKRQRQGMWIRVRYLLPLFVALLTLITLFIPCFRYTTPQTGTNDVVSCAELLANSWSGTDGTPSVREVLFSGKAYAKATVSFSWAVLITILVSAALYVLAIVAAIWSAVGALRFFRAPTTQDESRILYITVFPNRVVTLLYEAMFLPLLLFPRLLALYYESIMNYTVLLRLTFAEPLMIGAVLYAGTVVCAILTRSTERKLGMDPFFRPAPPKEEKVEEAVSTEEEKPMTEAERRYEELNRKTKEEQAERIRRLLLVDEEKEREES